MPAPAGRAGEASATPRRFGSVLGSLAFLVLAPGTVGVLVPYWMTRWQMGPPILGLDATRLAGAALVVLGAAVVLDSFARFALLGLGTPAPILPTRHLVVRGLYRHVRNPMYLAVVSAVAGQGLLLGEKRLFGYAALLAVAFHLFVIGYEEPTLARTFGAEYQAMRANVPRWLPRLRPWRGGVEGGTGAG
ncbi:MAG TPA: isoprenylcysteine carboxylmethyltransferase family protein [Anaeromyxobacteraceae bacterium]|nr:isoprenylcysteine carboxylmethyltransferase family protein [Anaeromyxobacteraceae bacterium]